MTARSRTFWGCGYHDNLRPKALNSIKEERLAAKQEMKAISNILDYAGVKLEEIFPAEPLTPVDARNEVRTSCKIDGQTWSFIINTDSNEARWDTPTTSNIGHTRLVLCPDEGSPLFSAWQFLSHHSAAVGFNRDESQHGWNAR